MSSRKVAQASNRNSSEGSSIVGAIIGFAIGGPVGALIGGAIGSGVSDSSSSSSYNNYSRIRNNNFGCDFALRRQEERTRRDEQRRLERQLREKERRLQQEQKRFEMERERERQRKLEEERKKSIRSSWKNLNRELRNQIDSINSKPEREQLAESLRNAEQPYIRAMDNKNLSSAENIINQLRQDIISKQMDEKFIVSQKDELSKILSDLEREAPAGFKQEIDAIRKNDIKSHSNSIEQQNKKIKSLMAKAQNLAAEISMANSISIDDLVEETFNIPPVVVDEAEKAAVLQDIFDFGERTAFFDENEADRLRPLIDEAKGKAELPRLKLIRTQVKSTYNRLREQAVLTDMFKRDFNSFLPPMRKAMGTEHLCIRMEDLLTAPVISREEYNEVYKAVQTVLSEQLETITDAFFAEKVASTLNEMGYNFIDENGNPANLPPNTVRMIETPYEGYRVRVKVGKDNTVATRLVRIVGSEEEKASTSEYQLQQDIEICKKWRENILDFYKVLENEGIKMDIVLSTEPGEQPLDIVVDKSFKRQSRVSAAERSKSVYRKYEGKEMQLSESAK